MAGDSSNSSSSSEHEVTMPSALAFLVANFHSLVTIKLDTGTDNYLLWKTQVLNATRANGFFQYIDGSIVCPPKEIINSSNTMVVNEAFLKWKLIDNQLLSCLTSSLTASTLSLVMGLDSASEVWLCLEHRFNSMSRSNLHDLKRELFNFDYKKSGNLNAYIDEIKICAQKLGAVGYTVDDDDMIFHTLNGLPTEYDTLKQTIRTQRDLKFYEVVTILKGEEKLIHKGKEDDGTSSVFLATQKVQDLSISGGSSSSSNPQSHSTFVQPNPSGFPMTIPSHGYQMTTPQGYHISPSVQPQFVPGPFFPASQGYQMFLPPQMFPQLQGNSGNKFHGNNRFNGNKSRGQNSGSRVECQICGRNNHSAKTCYYRNSDTPTLGQGFQSFPRPNSSQQQVSQQYQQQPQFHQQQFFNGRGGYPGYSQNQSSSQVHYTVTGPSSSNTGFDGSFCGPNQSFGGNFSSSYPSSNAFSVMPAPNMSSVAQAPSFSASSSVASRTTVSSQPWFFDSGATNHVTPDATTLTHVQPYSGGSGQCFPSSSSQGTLSSGALSYPELL